MPKLDRSTATKLDDEIARMTEEEQAELSRAGGQILKKTNTPEGKAKWADYMRRYKARIALAASRGLFTAENEQR